MVCIYRIYFFVHQDFASASNTTSMQEAVTEKKGRGLRVRPPQPSAHGAFLLSESLGLPAVICRGGWGSRLARWEVGGTNIPYRALIRVPLPFHLRGTVVVAAEPSLPPAAGTPSVKWQWHTQHGQLSWAGEVWVAPWLLRMFPHQQKGDVESSFITSTGLWELTQHRPVFSAWGRRAASFPFSSAKLGRVRGQC